MVVDNRAGANGTIGSEMMARTAPDRYTLLFGTSSTLARNLPFNPVKDFTPITIVYEGVERLSINSAVPLKSVQELIDYAKRNPGKLSYASSDGSAYHLDGELLCNIIVADTPEHFAATMKTDIADVGKIIKLLNIQPE